MSEFRYYTLQVPLSPSERIRHAEKTLRDLKITPILEERNEAVVYLIKSNLEIDYLRKKLRADQVITKLRGYNGALGQEAENGNRTSI
jgi:hypothetical protein